MWRKSDGATHGLVSEYRDDALGRQVMQKTWWELARRCYLDTRFELDINLDLDGDSSKLKLIDGGMTASIAAPPGQLGQSAQWSSRINRLSDNDAHYFDFLIDVPATTEGTGFCLGVLAYEDRQVRVFSNRYELWISGALISTHSATTLGRHNLGICAKGATSGEASGVWLDGSQIFGITGIGLYTFGQPRANFTTCDPSPNNGQSDNGLLLLDFFAYVKSYLRTIDDSSLDGGSGTGSSGTGNGVTPPATPFTLTYVPDGPGTPTSFEIALDGSGNTTGVPAKDEDGDPTRQAAYKAAAPADPSTILGLVDGCKNSSIQIAAGYGFYDESPESETVGVFMRIVHDGVNATGFYLNDSPDPLVSTTPSTGDGGAGGSGLKGGPDYTANSISIHLGKRRSHGTFARPRPAPDAVPEPQAETCNVSGAGASDLAGGELCACSGENPAQPADASHDNDADGEPERESEYESPDELFGRVVGFVDGVYVPINRGGIGVGGWSKGDLTQVRQWIKQVKADLFTTAPGTQFYDGLRAELADLMWLYETKGGEKLAGFDGVVSGIYNPTEEEIAYWKKVHDEFRLNQDRWATMMWAFPQHIMCFGGAVGGALPRTPLPGQGTGNAGLPSTGSTSGRTSSTAMPPPKANSGTKNGGPDSSPSNGGSKAGDAASNGGTTGKVPDAAPKPPAIEVKGHGERHIPKDALAGVTDAVRADIVKNGAPKAGETIQRTIEVGGKKYSYRAYGKADGTTSVGTVFEGIPVRDVSK